PVLGELVHELHELLAALFGERRQREPDDLPVVRGREPEIGRKEGLFHGFKKAPVPGLHRQELGFGGRDTRHLIERHLASVGLDPHQVEQRGRRLARADGGELAFDGLHGLIHQLFDVLRVVGEAHLTMVPTRSPASTLAVAPGWLMLNTTIGSPFSLHSPNALASITAYPFTSASWNDSSGMNFALGSRFGSAV